MHQRTSLALSLCLGMSASLLGQAPCSSQTVLAGVIDNRGKAVRGLGAENFKGEFRGKPVKIISTTLSAEQPRIVILLDVSGSGLLAENAKKLFLQLASDLISQAPPAVPIELITFAERAEISVPFGSARENFKEKIQQ